MLIILTSQEVEIRRISPGKLFMRHYLEKPNHKKGLAEWLKVKALSSQIYMYVFIFIYIYNIYNFLKIT
jgi:hypothetical protein